MLFLRREDDEYESLYDVAWLEDIDVIVLEDDVEDLQLAAHRGSGWWWSWWWSWVLGDMVGRASEVKRRIERERENP